MFDQIEVAEEALEQLPAEHAADAEIVLRFDSAGATHGLLDWAREGRIRFSVGFDLTEPVRKALARIPHGCWVSALNQDGSARDNGEVAEATDLIDLSGWPEGSRLIVRRERPHPGAQLSFTDADGHRFQAILTDRAGEATDLERCHRARARCEDRIRCTKQIGLELLPFADFKMNAVWMELVLIAQLLLALTDTLLLRGELSGLEPKRLRYRALHTAGRIAFHARRATRRLERRWPWAEELAVAFARLRKLPVPGRPAGRLFGLDPDSLHRRDAANSAVGEAGPSLVPPSPFAKLRTKSAPRREAKANGLSLWSFGAPVQVRWYVKTNSVLTGFFITFSSCAVFWKAPSPARPCPNRRRSRRH